MRVFDSTAILLYLAEKTGRFNGAPENRGELLFWLSFIGTGLGSFSGQAVHFQLATPEKPPYVVNRYRREAERHYQVLADHLNGQKYIVGNDQSIADIASWGWINMAKRAFSGDGNLLAAFPNIKRCFDLIEDRPAASRARLVGTNHPFKKERDEEALRALFPSNY